MESVDPLVLRRAQLGLKLAFRFAAPSDVAGGNVQWGELEITTNRESFKIGVGPVFHFPTQSTASKHAFFSWTLAKVVDDLEFSRMGKRMPEDRIKSLSGEATIASLKAQFEKEEKAGADHQK